MNNITEKKKKKHRILGYKTIMWNGCKERWPSNNNPAERISETDGKIICAVPSNSKYPPAIPPPRDQNWTGPPIPLVPPPIEEQ